ncbi:MAG TPA: DUF433 domain-containing protein [Tepidisphaeraceae bacterium]|nr:DUF433 domain-containing protein [Tepidisphaeraceae bacterium]
MVDQSLLSRITVDPEICHGKPCVRGMRYPVESILEYLAGGDELIRVLQARDRTARLLTSLTES